MGWYDIGIHSDVLRDGPAEVRGRAYFPTNSTDSHVQIAAVSRGSFPSTLRIIGEKSWQHARAKKRMKSAHRIHSIRSAFCLPRTEAFLVLVVCGYPHLQELTKIEPTVCRDRGCAVVSFSLFGSSLRAAVDLRSVSRACRCASHCGRGGGGMASLEIDCVGNLRALIQEAFAEQARAQGLVCFSSDRLA